MEALGGLEARISMAVLLHKSIRNPGTLQLASLPFVSVVLTLIVQREAKALTMPSMF